MDSNEFNNVTVTNEGKTYDAEFTKAQKYEFSSQTENSTTVGDELNDRHTINDSIEENTLKSSKDEDKKKEEEKQARENAEKITETASSVGSSVGSVAVSVATASVVVIGAVAGISIIEQQKEHEDLITFVSSEITTNSVDFTFRMPAVLMSYEEGQISDVSYKKVIGELISSDGYFEQQEYALEEIDEETLEGYGGFSGLTPDTPYALTITLLEYSYDEETQEEIVENPIELAYRAFSTLPQQSVITFDPLDITYNSVSFSFTVALSDIGYNPESPSMPSLFATLDDRSLTLTEYDIVDDNHVRIYGNFTQLQPLTTYTLEIYLEVDRESRLLGSTTFTTLERTSSVVFDAISVTRTEVNFVFTVDKEDVDYVEGVTPSVRMSVSNGSDYYDEVDLQQYEVVGDTIQGYGTFTGLPLGNSFDLTISLLRQSEVIELGATTFDNYSGFQWVIDPTKQVTGTTTLYNFAIKKAYIGYVSDEETPDVIDQIHAEVLLREGGTAGAWRPSSIMSYNTEYCTCVGDIDGLTPETDYILNIYYQPGNEQPELLGSYDFTTKEGPGGLHIGDIISSSSNAIVPFEINSSEVNLSGQDSNIRLFVEYGAYEITSTTVSSSAFTEASGGKLQAEVYFDNLPANTLYSVLVNNATTGETYGSKVFATSNSEYGLQFTNMTATSDTFVAECYVDPNAFNIDWSDQYDVAQLENQIYIEYFDETGSQTYQPQYISELSKTSSDVAEGKFDVSGLTPSTKYIAIAYYDDGNSNVTALGMIDFTTDVDQSPEINSIITDYAIVFDSSTNQYVMPIQIDYTDPSGEWSNGFTIQLDYSGITFEGTLVATTYYQYAFFSDASIAQYADGTTECDVGIYDVNTGELLSQLYVGTPFVPDINYFYSASISGTTDFTEDNLYLYFTAVCAIGDPTAQIQLVMIDEVTNGEFVFNLTLRGADSGRLSVSLANPGSYPPNVSLEPYSSLQQAYANPLTIKIEYKEFDGSSETKEVILGTGVQFTFSN